MRYLPNKRDALQAHIMMHKVHKLGNAQTGTNYYTYYQNLIKNKSAHSKISNAFWSVPGISHEEMDTVIKYRSGTIYNQKHAVRFKQSNSLNCPICSCQDSALHILSGCQHPIIRNMVTKRYNIAGRLCHARLVSLPNQCHYPFAVSWLLDICCCDWIALFD